MQVRSLPALVAAAVCAWTMVQAQTGAPARAQEGEVFTRAIVRSTFQEDSGRRQYIRLKLIPKGKLPFSTLTYRVLDASLVTGFREGDSVAFRAERRDGENVLTAIRPAPPCERFRQCE